MLSKLINLVKKRPKWGLALDIGTEFVKALVFELEYEDKRGVKKRAIIKGASRQRQGLSEMHSGAILDIERVLLNCEEVINRASEEAGIFPKKVILGIAGELVKGIVTRLEIQRKRPEKPINLKELEQISKKAIEKALSQVRNQISLERGNEDIDIRLVNSGICDLKIDGYKILNPVGFRGKNLILDIFCAFAPLVHLSSLETIATELGLELIGITAQPYAVSQTFSENPEFGAIFIDIGGGTTDISVVRQGAIEGTKMFALGGRVFTKRIAQVLDLPFEKAEELKINYSVGKNLDQKIKNKLREILLEDAKVWLEGVILALSEFSLIDYFPSQILLCGGGSLLPEIKEVLKDLDWTKKLAFTKKPKINFITPKDINRISDETGKLKNPWDITPLSLVNIALDLMEEDLISSLFSKTTSLLEE